MTGSKMVFLDTAPIIYYLQCNELYYTNMKEFWKEYAACVAGCDLFLTNDKQLRQFVPPAVFCLLMSRHLYKTEPVRDRRKQSVLPAGRSIWN